MAVEVGGLGLVFGEAMTKLVAAYAARTLLTGTEKLLKVKRDLSPHIDATFRRCASIKTLLNPFEPVDFLSIYATQRFHKENVDLDHYALVDIIKSGKNNHIITGTGGSGKSIFMRYLWLSLFENPDGRVPIFIELRNSNSVSNLDFESYILHSLTLGAAKISQADFSKGLRAGDYVLLLDGFDEISLDRRELVQRSVMDLATNYPELKIVVSSRPDDVFASWTSFYVYTVRPMQKPDVIELVERSRFDDTSKSRFIKKIKDDNLYETHKSFLSNPLLCSMMLLTFSVNFDIPNKMHLFYEQAFDALYKRHDSHKPGGYKREFKSGLSEDEFKRILSLFCLITYHKEKFEFEREEILSFIRKALSVDGVKRDPEMFLHDMATCICFVVLDGISYAFSHRSFQEYFAAYCLAYVTTQEAPSILKAFSRRPYDEVMRLLSDMNPEVFLTQYVVPNVSEFREELQLKQREKSPKKFMASSGMEFLIHFVRTGNKYEDDQVFTTVGQGELYQFFDVVSGKFAQGAYGGGAFLAQRETEEFVSADIRKIVGRENAIIINIGADARGLYYRLLNPENTAYEEKQYSEGLNALFEKSRMSEFLTDRLKKVSIYLQAAEKRSDKSATAMSELFGL